MIPPIIAAAIETRIKADTTLWDTAGGGSWKTPLAGGLRYTQGSPGEVTYPYITMDISTNGEHAFQGTGDNAVVEFSIVDGRQSGVAAPGVARLVYLMERLFGNSMITAGKRVAPDYGLHNYLLPLPTNTLNLTSSHMTCGPASLRPGSDEHTLEAIATYTCFVSSSETP